MGPSYPLSISGKVLIVESSQSRFCSLLRCLFGVFLILLGALCVFLAFSFAHQWVTIPRSAPMGFVWVLACAIPGWFLLRSGWRRLWPLNRNAAPIDLGILGHRRNALRHAGLTLLLVATLVGIGYWLRYENSQNRSVSPPDPRFEALLAEWSTGKPVVT